MSDPVLYIIIDVNIRQLNSIMWYYMEFVRMFEEAILLTSSTGPHDHEGQQKSYNKTRRSSVVQGRDTKQKRWMYFAHGSSLVDEGDKLGMEYVKAFTTSEAKQDGVQKFQVLWISECLALFSNLFIISRHPGQTSTIFSWVSVSAINMAQKGVSCTPTVVASAPDGGSVLKDCRKARQFHRQELKFATHNFAFE
jgi:hypothetical protein